MECTWIISDMCPLWGEGARYDQVKMLVPLTQSMESVVVTLVPRFPTMHVTRPASIHTDCG